MKKYIANLSAAVVGLQNFVEQRNASNNGLIDPEYAKRTETISKAIPEIKKSVKNLSQIHDMSEVIEKEIQRYQDCINELKASSKRITDLIESEKASIKHIKNELLKMANLPVNLKEILSK